jgi:signal transduction histidine kinase
MKNEARGEVLTTTSSKILAIIALSAIYFLSGKFSIFISNTGENIVTIAIFMAEGFALASAILLPRIVLLGVFFGQFILAYNGGLDLYPSLLISIINTAEALIGSMLFNKFKLDKSLSHRRDIFGLMILIILILQPFSAILGNIVLLYFSVIEKHNLLISLFSWWLGNLMGQLMITTLILSFVHYYKKIDITELMLIGFVFFALTFIFLIKFKVPYVSLLSAITMPFLIYLTYKRNISYALFSVFIISMVGIVSAYINVGSFASDGILSNIISLNFFIFSHLILILIIGTLFEENRQNAIINIKQKEKLLKAEKLTSIVELMGNIAHHWRQPLSVISTSATGLSMQNRLGMLDDEILERNCKRIDEQAQLLSQTIDRFTKDLKRNKAIAMQSFNMSQSIKGLLKSKKDEFKKYNIEVITHLQEINLISDESKLLLCILNILNNSKDVFDKRLIENRVIIITTKTISNHHHITIKDSAGGIDEDIITKVFEPYFTTKHQAQDVGMGLYIVYDIIVDKLKGNIEVQNVEFKHNSNMLRGAEFEIEI